MSDVMQGYDLDAAVRQIGKAIGKAAKAAPDAAEAFRAARHRGGHALYA